MCKAKFLAVLRENIFYNVEQLEVCQIRGFLGKTLL